MSALLTIARSAVREHSRRKLIAVLVGLSLVTSAVVAWLGRGGQAGAIFGQDTNLGAVAALGVLQLVALVAALAVSMGNIGQPFESGQALMILARPVARWQFALGRYAASVVVLTGLCLLMALETQAVQLIAGGKADSDLWLHWLVVLFNHSVIAAYTTLISAVISLPVVVAIIAFFFHQVIGTILGLQRLVQAQVITGTSVPVIDAIWNLSPKYLVSPLESGQAKALAEQGELVFSTTTPGLVVWASAWLLGFLVLSVVATSRREL